MVLGSETSQTANDPGPVRRVLHPQVFDVRLGELEQVLDALELIEVGLVLLQLQVLEPHVDVLVLRAFGLEDIVLLVLASQR